MAVNRQLAGKRLQRALFEDLLTLRLGFEESIEGAARVLGVQPTTFGKREKVV